MLFEGGEHFGGDEGNATLAAVEPFCVELGILTDYQTLADPAAAIEHDFGQPGMTADFDLRQEHGLVRFGKRIDPAIRE